MYRTCLYCTRDLGSNDILETLPIGRRVAFDAAQGRLWVVCRACEKWNLVPFDTRLETIDRGERLFRETRTRFSTDHIGIARLKEGLELVRIGAAQRPEFAAWRYGDQFGRRRTRAAGTMALAGAATIAFIAARHVLFPVLGASTFGFQFVMQGVGLYQRRRTAIRIPGRNGPGGFMTRAQVRKARILTRSAGTWSLEIDVFERSRAGFATGFTGSTIEVDGAEAINALGYLMPGVNASGGGRRHVRGAVELVEEWPDVNQLMAVRPGVSQMDRRRPRADLIRYLDVRMRLALEMAAHEASERTALAGELKLLEREWRKAEELAAIADNLAVSDEVRERLDDGV